MKTPSKEEISVNKAEEIISEFGADMPDCSYSYSIVKDIVNKALTDMQQPVDVEAITGAFMIWYLKQSEYPSPKDVINFFLPYLQQPAPQSDAVDEEEKEEIKEDFAQAERALLHLTKGEGEDPRAEEVYSILESFRDKLLNQKQK